jgi:hypothetical protein
MFDSIQAVVDSVSLWLLTERVNRLNLFLVKKVVVEEDETVPNLIVIRAHLSKWGYLLFGLVQWLAKRKLSGAILQLPAGVEVTVEATYEKPKK